MTILIRWLKLTRLSHIISGKGSPLKTLFERKCAEHAVCGVKPPSKAYSLALSVFLAADSLHPFSLFKPVFSGSRQKQTSYPESDLRVIPELRRNL